MYLFIYSLHVCERDRERGGGGERERGGERKGEGVRETEGERRGERAQENTHMESEDNLKNLFSPTMYVPGIKLWLSILAAGPSPDPSCPILGSLFLEINCTLLSSFFDKKTVQPIQSQGVRSSWVLGRARDSRSPFACHVFCSDNPHPRNTLECLWGTGW